MIWKMEDNMNYLLGNVRQPNFVENIRRPQFHLNQKANIICQRKKTLIKQLIYLTLTNFCKLSLT